MKLNKEKWKYYITSDEALFTLDDANGQRKVQYIAYDQKRSEAKDFTKSLWPKQVMVWVGMSSKGLIGPIFVKPEAKINTKIITKTTF